MPTQLINLLPQDGAVFLFDDFIDTNIADAWYYELLTNINWQQYEIKLFGKKVMQPRLSAWFANAGIAYAYSGLKLEPMPFTPLLFNIKNSIESTAKLNFNSVLLNLYRSGSDSMGMHSDDEKELGSNPVIASLSLGATRTFVLKHKRIKALQIKVPLTHGSLLMMQGSTQHNWQHALPKTSALVEPRINLTFRKII